MGGRCAGSADRLPHDLRQSRGGRCRAQPRHVDRPEAGGPVSRPALAVADLRIELWSGEPVVEDVSFRVGAGEVLGLVGESGSGKTTTALALLGYARPGVRIAAGSIEVSGTHLSGLRELDLRRHRGKLISYVPQDPASALNPSIRVGDQVAHLLRRHADGA